MIMTTISLRKANAIQQSILEMTRGVSFEALTSISEFEDVDTKLAAAKTISITNIAAITDLYEALYSIRLLVSDANATSGINGLLTRMAHMEKLIQVNNNVASSKVQEDLAIVKGKLDKIRNGDERAGLSSYSSRISEVATGVYTKEELANFKLAANALKKAKTKLQDQVLELNIRTTIELPENVVAILETADLL
jgi:hypothetical protein